MDEKTKKENTEKVEKTKSAEDNDDGIQQEESGLVDSAYKAAKELRAENDRREKLLKEEKEFEAKRMLAGSTNAGSKAPVQKETPEEYTKRFMKGEANPLKDDGIKIE